MKNRFLRIQIICALSLFALALSAVFLSTPQVAQASDKVFLQSSGYVDENSDGNCDNTPGSGAGGGSGAAQGPKDGNGPRRDGSGGGAGSGSGAGGGNSGGGGGNGGGGNGGGGNGGGGGRR